MRITLLSLSDPDGQRHGGTLRTSAMRDILEAEGHTVTTLFPAAAIGEQLRQNSLPTNVRLSVRRKVLGKASALKRKLLPMPTASGARDAALSASIRLSRPDLIIVSALSQRNLARQARCDIWVDFMDVWSNFAERESKQRSGIARFTSALQARALRHQESALIRESAIVTAAGWTDAEALKTRENASVHWLPTWLDYPETPPAHDVGKVAGFIGNFDYWPNVAAYEMLVQEWLPVLRAAGWKVVVAGRHADRLTRHPDIEMLGEVDTVQQFYSSISLSLAPVRLGGGIKVKVVESLMNGVPVLASPEAVEGLPPNALTGVLVAPKTPSVQQMNEAVNRRVDRDSLRVYHREGALGIIRSALGEVR